MYGPVTVAVVLVDRNPRERCARPLSLGLLLRLRGRLLFLLGLEPRPATGLLLSATQSPNTTNPAQVTNLTTPIGISHHDNERLWSATSV